MCRVVCWQLILLVVRCFSTDYIIFRLRLTLNQWSWVFSCLLLCQVTPAIDSTNFLCNTFRSLNPPFRIHIQMLYLTVRNSFQFPSIFTTFHAKIANPTWIGLLWQFIIILLCLIEFQIAYDLFRITFRMFFMML